MPSVMGTKEFLYFQQTIRDLERQVDILLREAATNGPSQRTRELTEKVYLLAERAKQIRLPEDRKQSTTNQSILEKLPKQFDEDFGQIQRIDNFRRMGPEAALQRHRPQPRKNLWFIWNQGNFARTPSREAYDGYLRNPLRRVRQRIPQSERRDYPIHVLLHDHGQWEVCTGQSDCECQGYEGKGVRIGVNLSPERLGKG